MHTPDDSELEATEVVGSILSSPPVSSLHVAELMRLLLHRQLEVRIARSWQIRHQHHELIQLRELGTCFFADDCMLFISPGSCEASAVPFYKSTT